MARLFILEDTLVAATEMAISTQVWLDMNILEDDYLLFWKDPAFTSIDKLRGSISELSRYRQRYEGKYNLYSLDDLYALNGCSTEEMYTSLESRHNDAMRILSSSLNSLELKEFPFISFMGINIGSAILQTILSNFPECHFEIGANLRPYIRETASCIVGALLLLDLLNKICPVHSVVFSEHTYNCSALVEFCKINNISCPRLQDPLHSTTPLSYPDCEFKRSEWHSCFSRFYRRNHMYLTERHIAIGREFLDSLCSRVNSINIAEVHPETNRKFGDNILKRLSSYACKTSVSNYIRSSNASYTVVFYLDTYSDAPYTLGNSGFVSSVHFILYMAKSFTSLLGSDVNLIFKLHPNMLLPELDPTPHRISLVERDWTTITKLFENLSCSTQNLYILDDTYAPLLMSSIPSCLHCTHHGTVALEMMHLNSPVLYTCLAPYAGLGISKREIESFESYELIKGGVKEYFVAPEYNKEILYRYVYSWQNSMEVQIYKARQSLVAQISKEIPIQQVLSRISNGENIEKIIGPERTNIFKYLSLAAYNTIQ